MQLRAGFICVGRDKSLVSEVAASQELEMMK